MKVIAGRFKDQEDAFFFSREGLVNRKLIKENVIKTAGEIAWEIARHGYQRCFDIADNKSLEDRRNEAAGYIDS